VTEKKPESPTIVAEPKPAQEPIVHPVAEVTGPGTVNLEFNSIKIDNSILPSPDSIARLQELGVWDDVLLMAKERQAHEMAIERMQVENNTLALRNQRDIAELDNKKVLAALGERKSQRRDGMFIVCALFFTSVGLLIAGRELSGLGTMGGTIALIVGAVYASRGNEEKKAD
jgi:hypothetical protein